MRIFLASRRCRSVVVQFDLNADTVRMFEGMFGPICGSRYSVASQRRFRIIKVAGGAISLKPETSEALIHGSAWAEAKIRQHLLCRAWEGDETHLRNSGVAFGAWWSPIRSEWSLRLTGRRYTSSRKIWGLSSGWPFRLTAFED